jgi:hypothetical protein
MSADRKHVVASSKSLVSRRRAFRQAFDRLEDRRLMATYTVTTNANTGAGSLRDAVNNANLNPGADTIAFNLPIGSRTITLTTTLPALSGPTTIDGTTNPGYNGAPVVEVTGANVLTGNAIELNGNGSVVRGLSITGFASGVGGASGRGIVLNASNSTIEKNYFALKPDGATTLHLGGAGVEVLGGNNTIHDNAIATTAYGVLISTNSVNANNTVITGNRIGTNASGTTYLGGSTLATGVYIGAGNNNRLGGPTDAERNIIAIGKSAGVVLASGVGSAVTVQNNLIGLNTTGAGAITAGNVDANGVAISTLSTAVTIRGNYVANAAKNQIQVSSAPNVIIVGNYVGLTFAGAPSGTGVNGISISGDSAENIAVGTPASADRNWIMNGSTAGIRADNTGSNIRIQNNVVGIAPNGTVSSAGDAVNVVAGGVDFLVGGVGANAGNILHVPSNRNGIIASGMSATQTTGSTTIAGNQIGMNLAGTNQSGPFNAQSTGISVSSTTNALIKGNKIARVGTAIFNEGANYIHGNQIGLSADGLSPLQVTNGISSTNGFIGGPNPGEGNLIGDWDFGAILLGDGTSPVVQGNRIGTNVDGTGSYTGSYGVYSSVSSTIGGVNPGEGNLITGAFMSAVQLFDGPSKVQGNTLGQPGRPNGNGVTITADGSNVTNTVIGGDTAAAGNVIAYNSNKAIIMIAKNGNTVSNVTVRRNVIHSNASMAIDLGNDGATVNDALDADTGANGLQNTPFLVSADSTGGAQTVVSGFMNTSGSTPIVIDFYSADVATNEARTWLGSKTIFTDVAGGATFTHTLPFVPGNKYIVATATNIIPAPHGATSELSAGVQVTGPADTTQPTVASSSFEFESGHAVKLVFSEDMNASSLQASDLTMTNTTTNQSVAPSSMNYNAATKTATFAFATTLADGNYAFALNAGAATDLAGNGNLAHTGNTFVLAGDANRDKKVDFSDLLILAANYNTSGKTFSQGNFNYDAGGNVSFDDLLILASRYNTSLTGAPGPLVAPNSNPGSDDAGSVGDDVLA